MPYRLDFIVRLFAEVSRGEAPSGTVSVRRALTGPRERSFRAVELSFSLTVTVWPDAIENVAEPSSTRFFFALDRFDFRFASFFWVFSVATPFRQSREPEGQAISSASDLPLPASFDERRVAALRASGVGG